MAETRENPMGIGGELVDLRERRLRKGTIRDRRRRLDVGLVNNMPDAAVAATERQFAGLLREAGPEYDLRLRLLALHSVPRDPATRAAMARRYARVDMLAERPFDGLIVTGAEPNAASLDQEPYWDELRRLLDHADERTASTILSCLAAHAGALHFDAIARRPLAAKISGVFKIEVAAPHPLAQGLEAGFLAPHSRRNGLDAGDLAAAGYALLSGSPEIGVDAFHKRGKALFLFLQGHPEYDADSLAREYRRDMARFLNGQLSRPPEPPKNYFLAQDEAAMRAFAAQAAGLEPPRRPQALPEAFARALCAAPWRAASLTLYRNWLGLLAERTAERLPIRRYGG